MSSGGSNGRRYDISRHYDYVGDGKGDCWNLEISREQNKSLLAVSTQDDSDIHTNKPQKLETVKLENEVQVEPSHRSAGSGMPGQWERYQKGESPGFLKSWNSVRGIHLWNPSDYFAKATNKNGMIIIRWLRNACNEKSK